MPTKPIIILSQPQLGENIGACARVMCNFGLEELRIIAPRDGWPNPKANDMAKSARYILDQATIYENLPAALTDIQSLYATTTRPRDMVKQVVTPKEMIKAVHEQQADIKVAILFGPERTGLTNDDIILADNILTIPVSDQYNSLNLAQAVAICAYEYFTYDKHHLTNELTFRKSEPATKQDVHYMIKQLEEALDKTNFFQVPEKKEKMMQNIGNIFTRTPLSQQDVRTLQGMLRALAEK